MRVYDTETVIHEGDVSLAEEGVQAAHGVPDGDGLGRVGVVDQLARNDKSVTDVQALLPACDDHLLPRLTTKVRQRDPRLPDRSRE